MDVSLNGGTPKSSIVTGFSIIFTIHSGVPLFLETPIYVYIHILKKIYIHPYEALWYFGILKFLMSLLEVLYDYSDFKESGSDSAFKAPSFLQVQNRRGASWEEFPRYISYLWNEISQTRNFQVAFCIFGFKLIHVCISMIPMTISTQKCFFGKVEPHRS